MNDAGIDEVLDQVLRWPSSSRIPLARRILESLEPPSDKDGAGPTRGAPAESVVGLLRSDRGPPDDEECRRIIEEERWRKHGPGRP